MYDLINWIRGFPGQIKSSICITIILSIFFIILSYKIRRIDPLLKPPKWFIPFLMFVETINNFTKENIGRRWRYYAPYFVSLSIFILVSNLSVLVGLLPPTSYLLINATHAVITFFIIQISGIVSRGFFGYLLEYTKPNPVLLPINLIGDLSLPLSLTLRLTGNILAGIVISNIIVGAFGYFGIFILPITNVAIDIFAGVIQTAVFVMLTIIFTSMKIEDEEKINI